MSSLSTLPKGDSAWLLRKSLQRVMQQVSVLEANIGSSTTGNSANTQIIFNDTGTLRGDPDLTFNTALNRLVATNLESTASLLVGTSATITGDLTVDTSTLKVDAANNRVGVNTASPAYALDVVSAGGVIARLQNTASTADANLIVQNTLGSGFFGINATGQYMYTPNSIPLLFYTAASERMRIDSSGNLGLGVTPSAWISAFKVMEFAAAGSVSALSDEFGVNNNSVYLTATNWTYKNTGWASQYRQSLGQHRWYNAPSGTAGNAITFTQAMTLDASGNLLVGTTSAVGRFTLENSATTNEITLRSTGGVGTNNRARIIAGYEAGGSNYGGYLAFNTTGNGNANNEAARFDASGNLLVGVTSANASGGVLQLKSGITFPATQVASSDANTLDDYEEGTWTGTLKGSVSDPTTPVTATGRYTKIGRQVYVEIAYNAISNVGASGAIFISGLPFAAANQNTGAVMMSSIGTFTNSSLSSFVASSATNIEIYVATSNAAVAGVQHNAGTGRSLWATLTYTI